MILLEVSTESGATYVANVVNKRIRRIAPDGVRGNWFDYRDLLGGDVNDRLVIVWPDGAEPTVTTPVVKVNFSKVE